MLRMRGGDSVPIFLRVLCLAFAASARNSTLVRLEDSDALCIDGNPGGYYFRAGAATTKWYIHHEGGGWCQMERPYESWPNDNCAARRSTRLGSLEGDPAAADWTSTTGCAGCSDDAAINPLMHDWNNVYVRYCDGGSFSGTADVAAPNGTLYFRGKRVLRAVVDSLMARGLGAATDVVVGGSSAGGLAVILHLDYWRSRLPRTATVVGLADSGFFLDWKQNGTSAHSYDEDLRWGFEHMRYDVDCDAGADCAFAEHALAHVRTPVFLLQTTYDSWQLQWELGEKNPVDYAALNAYGRELEDKLRAAGARAGGFVERCYHHCTTRDLWTTTPRIDGVAAGGAFAAFYRAVAAGAPTPPLLWQDGALPCAGCACPGGMVGP